MIRKGNTSDAWSINVSALQQDFEAITTALRKEDIVLQPYSGKPDNPFGILFVHAH